MLTFEEACELVRKRSSFSHATRSDQRLLYTYYKVATVGPAPDVPRPFNPIKAPFWDAWKQHGASFSPEDARQRYATLVEALSR